MEVLDPVTGTVTKKSDLCIMTNCRDLIRNLPLLQHDSKNVNDVSVTPHDITHNTDALRYFCVSHVSIPKRAVEPPNKYDEYKKKVLDRPKRRVRW